MRMRARSSWPANVMPKRSKTSRSAKATPGYTSAMVATSGSAGGNLADRSDATVARVREEVRDHLVAFGCHAGRHDAVLVDEMVDGGQVDTLREALVVTQEHRHVVPLVDADVHDRLAVRVHEHRPGEPLDQGGRRPRRRVVRARELLHECRRRRQASGRSRSFTLGRKRRRAGRPRYGRRRSPYRRDAA